MQLADEGARTHHKCVGAMREGPCLAAGVRSIQQRQVPAGILLVIPSSSNCSRAELSSQAAAVAAAAAGGGGGVFCTLQLAQQVTSLSGMSC
jgi:hypothetical protein